MDQLPPRPTHPHRLPHTPRPPDYFPTRLPTSFPGLLSSPPNITMVATGPVRLRAHHERFCSADLYPPVPGPAAAGPHDDGREAGSSPQQPREQADHETGRLSRLEESERDDCTYLCARSVI